MARSSRRTALAVACLVSVLSLSAAVHGASCSATPLRRDCGYVGIDQQSCEAKGCCWAPLDPNPSNEPWCYYPGAAALGYDVSSKTSSSTGLSLALSLAGQGPALFGQDTADLVADVSFDNDERVHVKISSKSGGEYEVPSSILPRPAGPKTAPSSPLYKFSYTSSPFGFSVARADDGTVLFNTSTTDGARQLIYEDDFRQISTSTDLSEFTTYGLGEHSNSKGFPLAPGTYTLWAKDIPSATPDVNLYGSHPLYVQIDTSGRAHGVFLLNSNGMDVELTDTSLTYRTIGGVLDFYILMGPTPADVVRQYTDIVGRPHMPPKWALGFHQCKYGYTSIYEVEEVVQNYTAAGIPLDTMWTDIDYMDRYRDFTFDPKNFPVSEVRSFVDKLHKNGQQYVVIVDAGIAIANDYSTYTDGLAKGVYVQRSASDSSPFDGRVWPGPAVFPDFLNPTTQSWWKTQVSQFLSSVPLDGLWLDMNEVSNFDNDKAATYDPKPLYHINNGGSHETLRYKGMNVTAVHHGGLTEYNVHNLFGLSETIATRHALEEVTKKRSFIISRSTFPGTGTHAGHWTGDNAATWNDLRWSIQGMLDFNLFGVPMVGSDICGFLDDTTEELCSRWIELGAFYPFSRDHSSIGTAPQELYRWPSVAAIARTVLSARYQLVPYFYTLFADASNIGATVARPLWFEFNTDTSTHLIDAQFMLGSALMVTPVLQEGAKEVTGYFPATRWYSWWTGELLDSRGAQHTFDATGDVKVQVHIRGGSIVPVRDYKAPQTVKSMENNAYGMIVALDGDSRASGSLYVDDGESVGTRARGQYTELSMAVSERSLLSSVTHDGYAEASNKKVDFVSVLGLSSSPRKVKFNGDELPSSQWSFDQSVGRLNVVGLGATLNERFELSW